LTDRFGRTIDHLRLSVTARCDLRCTYCRPAGTPSDQPGADLTGDQRVDLVRLLAGRFGLAQVRLTGGEPLLDPTLVPLIAAIRTAVPALAIAMTTNGRRMAELAAELRAAGLDRLNVSLDSLDPAVYRRITGGELRPVLDGLDAAEAAGFPPPRINTVVLRDLNHTGLASLARWALHGGREIRFLEAMPIGPAAAFNRDHFVPAAQILSELSTLFDLSPLGLEHGATADRYQARDGWRCGVVGIIAPVSRPFCGSCRRIRVTADGRLFPCLLDSRFVDLRPAWTTNGFDAPRAADLIRSAVGAKAERGTLQSTPMIRLGG
jgi:cyclic pyranopterin phosphate synthase